LKKQTTGRDLWEKNDIYIKAHWEKRWKNLVAKIGRLSGPTGIRSEGKPSPSLQQIYFSERRENKKGKSRKGTGFEATGTSGKQGGEHN